MTIKDLSDSELLAKASPRPWFFDGRDILRSRSIPSDTGHYLVIPLPDNTFHPSQKVSYYDIELIIRAVNAYGGTDASE
jgi:hypothetical protein